MLGQVCRVQFSGEIWTFTGVAGLPERPKLVDYTDDLCLEILVVKRGLKYGVVRDSFISFLWADRYAERPRRVTTLNRRVGANSYTVVKDVNRVC